MRRDAHTQQLPLQDTIQQPTQPLPPVKFAKLSSTLRSSAASPSAAPPRAASPQEGSAMLQPDFTAEPSVQPVTPAETAPSGAAVGLAASAAAQKAVLLAARLS